MSVRGSYSQPGLGQSTEGTPGGFGGGRPRPAAPGGEGPELPAHRLALL